MDDPQDIDDQRLLRLRAGQSPWPERRDWVPDVARKLFLHPDDARARELLIALAGDPKWEVRKAVAGSMLGLPEPVFAAVFRKLNDDPNAYVAGAVQRAIERRAPRPDRRGRSRHRGLQRQLKDIGESFGPDAARMAAAYGDRMADEVLQSVAHDIKSALTPLQMNAGEIEAKAGGDPYVAARTANIARRIKDLQNLLGDINALSRPINMVAAPENIGALAEEAAKNARADIREEGADRVSVTFDIPDTVRLPVSRPHILMAMTNLIKNAIESHLGRSGFRAGNVAVSVSRSDGSVAVSIRDTGGGLTQKGLAKVMEFVPGHTNKPGGTGYGIAIAKRYVEAHRGTLRIESEEGIGLTATILLPDA